MSTQILRLKDVISKTGLARSTIYARMADGTFPKSVALGGGWRDGLTMKLTDGSKGVFWIRVDVRAKLRYEHGFRSRANAGVLSQAETRSWQNHR